MRASEADLIASPRNGVSRLSAPISSSEKPSARSVIQHGIDAIHFADHAVLGEAVDDRDIVGELRFAKLGERRETRLRPPRSHAGATAIRRWSRAGKEGSSASVRRPPPRRFARIRSASLPAFPFPSETRGPREWDGACRPARARARAAGRPRPRGCRTPRPGRFHSVPRGPLWRARLQAWRSRPRSWKQSYLAPVARPMRRQRGQPRARKQHTGNVGDLSLRAGVAI